MSKSDRAEDAAFFYVPAILGVELEPWDHSGRQRAVDARLHYPDGRIAALEVTSAAGDGRRQLYALLEAHQTLPNPGNWTWSATIDDPRDFPELLERVERLVLKSEAKGLRQPEYAYDEAFGGDEDFAWLVRSSVKLWGTPSLPKVREDGTELPFLVTHGGFGGGVDEDLAGFGKAVEEVVAKSHVQKRVQKLTRDGRDEQHLFIVLDPSALPYEEFYPLVARAVVPPGRPILPGTVTHLWLLASFAACVLLGTSEGWTRYERSDYVNG